MSARRLLAVSGVTALALAAAIPAAVAAPGGEAGRPATDAVSPTASYIVQFTPDANRGSQIAAARAMGMTVTAEYDAAISGMAVLANQGQINALQKNPGVLRVESDLEVTAVADQTGATWGIDRIDGNANGTYSYTSTGTGVTAYVIDTGIRSTHADLAGRVLKGANYVSGKSTTEDCNGHGTHVAATIAGTTYGVAKGAKVVPVRVLNCQGSGTTSGLLSGINWVINNHVNTSPAVANLSLGFSAVVSSVDTAIENLIKDNVTVAIAAGNSDVDACTVSPARAPNALTVGATDSNNTRASFSNWGTCVDVFAPGVGITSAWYSSNTATNTISGTSMASPHVAGVAARILSANVGWSPAQVSGAITTNATSNAVVDPKGAPNRLLFLAATS